MTALFEEKLITSAQPSAYPEMRYWAAVGLAQLGIKGELKTCPAALLALLDDKDAYIACEAAYAVSYLGETEKGVKRLNYPQNEADRKIGYSLLECLSLDKAMQPAVRVHLANLKEKAEKLPRKANEDAGLMARGLSSKTSPTTRRHGTTDTSKRLADTFRPSEKSWYAPMWWGHTRSKRPWGER